MYLFAREGHYPKRVLADQIYRNRTNLSFCQSHGIRLAGKPLGRPPKNAVFDKRQMRADEIDRIQVEREFSRAKSSFGLGLIRAKLKETSKTVIALSILSLNLALIGRILRTLFQLFAISFGLSAAFRKMVFIQ